MEKFSMFESLNLILVTSSNKDQMSCCYVPDQVRTPSQVGTKKISNGGWTIYVSVNSKPDHPLPPPRGNFFDGRIPHPQAKRTSKPHPPGLKKGSKTQPSGHFAQLLRLCA